MNYDQVDTEYRLRHNDLLANIVHRYVMVEQFGTKINVYIFNILGLWMITVRKGALFLVTRPDLVWKWHKKRLD